MYEISKKVKELIISHNFDIIWFNNAIEGFISAKKNKNIIHIGMINDYTSVQCSLRISGSRIHFSIAIAIDLGLPGSHTNPFLP